VSFLAELPDDERALLFFVLTDTGSREEVSGYDLQAAWSPLAASAPSGGEVSSTTVTNLANMRHEMLKAVVNNLRA
jgi:hypothetical protein